MAQCDKHSLTSVLAVVTLLLWQHGLLTHQHINSKVSNNPLMACKKPATSEDPSTSTCAIWDTACEAALIEFLFKHKSKAGNGFNFKMPTFKAAAVHLASSTAKDGAKTATLCKNKWVQICTLQLLCRSFKR